MKFLCTIALTEILALAPGVGAAHTVGLVKGSPTNYGLNGTELIGPGLRKTATKKLNIG